jgi:beta-aspartyl-peptidase (threonine type)
MEHLPHVLLTGRGAERFAAEMGFARRDLLTEEAYRVWKRRLEEELPPEAATSSGLPHELYRWIDVASDPETPKGTVNLLAQDERSNLAAGASTSGWAWKYPGRLGDTPIIGAGIYADSRYGAAACTGLGEMAIRLSTARSLVFYLRSGSSLDEAARRAVADLEALSGPYLSRMHFVAIDNAGHHVGYTNQEGTTYAYMTPEMSEPVEAVRSFVPMRMCWGSRT